MALFGAYRGLRARSVLASCLAFGMAALAAPAAASAADVSVVLDQAKLVKLPEQVATVVVGNPLIADATVQAGGLVVVTGKGYGFTNILALDRAGSVLMEKSVEVRGRDADVVVVYRGVDRESYSCTPICERSITLGDNPAYFNAVLGQTGLRNSQAQAAGAAK